MQNYPWASLIKHHNMKVHGEGKVSLHHSGSRLWIGVSYQCHLLAILPLGKPLPPGTYSIKGWVYPRVGLDFMKRRKLIVPLRNRTQNLGCPIHSAVAVLTGLCQLPKYKSHKI